MFIVRNLENVSEQCQTSSVGCMFLVIVIQIYDSLNGFSPTPQTFSINTSLFVAAVLQREVTFGDLKSAFMQSDKDLSERPQGQLAQVFPWRRPSCRRDLGLWSNSTLLCMGLRALATKGHAATPAFSA